MSQFNAPMRRSGGDIDVYTGLLFISLLILAGGVFLLCRNNIEHSTTPGGAKGGVITLVGQ
jgi:hypothetical protein